MSTTHVFNSTDGLVLKALRGAVALNPALRLHAPSRSVYHTAPAAARVALVSGGGAGHEPAHAGYTGRGLLAASVSGDVFAAPPAAHVAACVQLAAAARGTRAVLLVVNNYTGDRLNFGLAAERARAAGVRVESVVVADDVALLSRPSLVGARGLAGNILICKFLGGAAEAGLELAPLKALGDALVGALASVGVGLAHCHVPGRPMSEGGEDRAGEEGGIRRGECELGLGLHNEPGVRRMQIGSAEALVREMLAQIMGSAKLTGTAEARDAEEKGVLVRPGDVVVVFVNNLGGMSALEMSALVHEAIVQLAAENIHPARVLAAPYMTSLNAPGFSLSLLNVSAVQRRLAASSRSLSSQTGRENESEAWGLTAGEVLAFLDAPTDASAWVGVRSYWPELGTRRDAGAEEAEAAALADSLSTATASPPSSSGDSGPAAWKTLGTDPAAVEQGIRGACAAVLHAAPDLTLFDTVLGDGDCGETFAGGARAVIHALDSGGLIVGGLAPAVLVARLAELLEGAMGGTSGALFGLYFTALANALSSPQSTQPSSTPPPVLATDPDPRTAPLAALRALSAYTPARPGDRTLVDALAPFCDALAAGAGIARAVGDARAGAERTQGMTLRLGRATYIGVGSGRSGSEGHDDGEELPPDPGAWGVAALLEGLLDGMGAVDRAPAPRG